MSARTLFFLFAVITVATSVPAAHAASATLTTYDRQYVGPGMPTIVQDDVTGDVTVAGYGLHVWRPVSCNIPGEGRVIFSSGIPLIGRGMITQLGTDWYYDNFVKNTGLKQIHIPSVVITEPLAYSYDPIDYSSIRKVVAIRDPTLRSGDTESEDVLFRAPTTPFSNSRRIEKIQKFTLNIDLSLIHI